MEVLEDADELFVCPLYHGVHKDTVSVIYTEGERLFVLPVGGDREPDIEVNHNALLWIDDLGDDCFGVNLQWFQQWLFWWGCIRCLGGLDVITCLLHVYLCIGHG